MWPINDSPAHKSYTELDFCKWHAFFNLTVTVVISLVERAMLEITPSLKLELLVSFILDVFQDTTCQNDCGLELCIATWFLRLIFLVFTFHPWMSYAWETWEAHFKAVVNTLCKGCVWHGWREHGWVIIQTLSEQLEVCCHQKSVSTTVPWKPRHEFLTN